MLFELSTLSRTQNTWVSCNTTKLTSTRRNPTPTSYRRTTGADAMIYRASRRGMKFNPTDSSAISRRFWLVSTTFIVWRSLTWIFCQKTFILWGRRTSPSNLVGLDSPWQPTTPLNTSKSRESCLQKWGLSHQSTSSGAIRLLLGSLQIFGCFVPVCWSFLWGWNNFQQSWICLCTITISSSPRSSNCTTKPIEWASSLHKVLWGTIR